MQQIEVKVVKTSYKPNIKSNVLFARLLDIPDDCKFDYQLVVNALSILFPDKGCFIEFQRKLCKDGYL